MNTTTLSLAAPARPDVSHFRLLALRGVYLLMAGGLAFMVWPSLLTTGHRWAFMDGVVACMLAAFSLLCAVGVRYPLAMLPVLLWELLWKSIWLLRMVLPEAMAGTMDENMIANVYACSLAVLIPLAMPWGYLKWAVLKGIADHRA